MALSTFHFLHTGYRRVWRTCIALIIFCLLPFANLTAQLNSNDPCAKYIIEDLQSPFFSSVPDKDQLARSNQLYSRSIVITAHDHCYSTHDFADMKAGGITVRTIKLTTDNTSWSAGIEQHVPTPGHDNWRDTEIDFSPYAKAVVATVKANPDVLIIDSVADIRKAKRTGKLGVIVSFEGGSVAKRPDGCLSPPVPDKCLEGVRYLYEIPLREFQPYWVTDNWLKGQLIDSDWEHAPINPYGERVLQELNDSGVVIDLSHMGPDTFKQTLRLIGPERPFILSHAAVARVSLCGKGGECGEYSDWTTNGPSHKNSPLLASFRREYGPPGGSMMLDDDAIGEVVKHHGVIALHFIEPFVSWRLWTQGQHPTVSDLVDEIDYIKDRFGIQYVALGPDYIPWKGDRTWIRGARDMTELKNVATEMVIRRYCDSDIEKVLGLNLLKLYGSAWKTH